MKILTKFEICFLNKNTVSKHGGNFVSPNNLLHEENLNYLIEAVNSKMFGEEVYPLISYKAAIYCYNIICNHIFTDGNKRTGLAAMLQFINENGFDISYEISTDIMTDFITKIASENSSIEECKQWFAENIVEMK
jgi:death on curing protein